MSLFKFDHLKPKGAVWYTLDGVHVPPNNPKPVRLQMRHAGRSNPAFTNAILKLQKENEARSGGGSSAGALNAADERQARLFAMHVVIGWEGIEDEAGNAVPITPALVEDLLVALAIEYQRPDIVNGAATYAYNADNFRDEPIGSAEDLGKR